MNQEPILTFKLPNNYNRDNLDNTTYLKRINPNKEYILPDIENYTETEYHIDNYEPIRAYNERNEVRLYKYNDNDGLLFDWEIQWSEEEYNPYIQHHIQGHVQFGTVTLYTHLLTYRVDQNLEYNLEKTSIAPQPVKILQAYNTTNPPQRAIQEIEETRETGFNVGFVPIQRRNTRLFLPPSGNGILKTRIYEHPKNYFKILRNQERYGNSDNQRIEDGKARYRVFQYLLNYWAVGDTTDPPPEVLYPIYGRYFHLPVPEIEEYTIVYEYIDHIPRRDYIEYLTNYRGLTKRQKTVLDNLENIDHSKQGRFRSENPNSILIYIQKKNRRQTRTFTEYLRLSQYIR